MSFNALTPRPSKVLMIDESYLKNTTELDQSVDGRLIRTSIQYMQDRYILPILGNNMFETWKTWIYSGVTFQNNAGFYFDANNLYVLETFVQPTLACATMISLVYKINLQLKNAGVEQSHEGYSTNATDKQVAWLSENYREQAAFYAQRCTQFLSANPDIFLNWLNPQLGTSGNGADLFYPERTQYNCGIHLPGISSNSASATAGQGVGWGLSVNQRLAMFGNCE
ncbi:MAG TPA: hypothetical protein VNX68_12910 [Nitrosopumilaceae archaeon]|jgi:hypothetical protein|nr:hypothetical protein [Nitrosopumilaceae archaeon]